MSDIAISVRNVSKCYKVFANQRARLLHALWPKHRAGVQEIWALKDINFEIRRGDAVAIIGRNGSGKSTLLEIITGTLSPTTGSIQTSVHVAALLELGSGFHPEYTGRENVFLNCLVLGLSRTEIEKRFDDIVNFAEIGDALDRPVKTYSSGMLVRLAFAVQVALEPEILIVDEALSVGDFFFQQKCFGRLRQMRERGLTLLFVSHDMGTVRDLCSTAVYLRKGVPEYIGDSKTAVRAYLAEQLPTVIQNPTSNISQTTTLQTNNLDLATIKRTALWSVPDNAEDGHKLLAIRLLGLDDQPTLHAKMGDKIRMQVFFRATPIEAGHISCSLKNRFDQIVSVISTSMIGMEKCSSYNASFAIAEFEVTLMLEAGLYSLRFTYGQLTHMNQGIVIDNTGWIGPLQIQWNYETHRAPFLGMFGLPVQAKLALNER